MRKLLYAPVAHVFCEMDTTYGKAFRLTYGRAGVEASDAYSRKLHCRIEDKLSGYDIDKVYVDGLDCGGEAAARYLASFKREGCLSARLALKVAKGGARLMKTERTPLVERMTSCTEILGRFLIEAYKPENMETTDESDEGESALLTNMDKVDRKRERYIPKRINRTLREGETALLLIGAEHNLKFAKSIEVTYLLDIEEVNRKSDAILDKYEKKI